MPVGCANTREFGETISAEEWEVRKIEMLRQRQEHAILCERDETYRAACVAMCKADPVFWINNFVWTFDPREEMHRRYLPFLLFPVQEEFMNWLVEKKRTGASGLVEKSRDMGATWMLLAFIVYMWLFEYGFVGIVGSKIEDYVYKRDDPDTLFWKMEFIVENLPDWMKPLGWKPLQHITYMKMINPVTKSAVNGEIATSDFGRSGRSSFALLDEMAFWDRSKEAWGSIGQTSKCRVANSTPNGMDFFGKLANPEPGSKAPDKFVLDWKDDPRKNSYTLDSRGRRVYPWYVAQQIEYDYDLTELAREVDRDYKRSARGRVYPQFDNAKIGHYPWRPGLPTYVAWDFGRDATALLWSQWDYLVGRYNIIDYVEASGETIDFFVPFITGLVPSGNTLTNRYNETQVEKILSHSQWEVHGHYGDPSGKATSSVIDFSVLDVLNSEGIYVVVNDQAKKFVTRIHAARMLLRKVNVHEATCRQWIEAMRNYRFPERSQNQQTTQPNDKPRHDKFSHGATAFEYLAVNERHSGEPLLPEGTIIDPQDLADFGYSFYDLMSREDEGSRGRSIAGY